MLTTTILPLRSNGFQVIPITVETEHRILPNRLHLSAAFWTNQRRRLLTQILKLALVYEIDSALSRLILTRWFSIYLDGQNALC